MGNARVTGCSWCEKRSPLKKEWRGTEIVWPHCHGPLLVNAFAVGQRA